MRKRIFILGIAAMALWGAACGKQQTDDGAGSAQVTVTAGAAEGMVTPTEEAQVTDEPTQVPQEPQTIIPEEASVKLLGRTQLMFDKSLLCAFSGSGMAFEYTGKKLQLELQGDSSAKEGNEDNCARIAIYVNDERTQEIILNKKTMTLNVWESDEAQTVQVRVVKLSECAQSTFAIRPIEIAAGESIRPAAHRQHAIEFVGDSITCGYGVDDPVASHHFSTQTEDVTKAYAYKTAEILDADYSMVSISGYGIISGYTGNPDEKADQQLMPKYYDKLGNSYAHMGMSIQPQSINWSFERFVPEVVVINLGTNDASYCKGDAAKKEEYIAGYVEFIKQVRSCNPDATIFCVLGLMGQDLCEAMETACERYCEATSDTRVQSFRLSVQDSALGIAADWHPTQANHQRAAEELSTKIREVMGW